MSADEKPAEQVVLSETEEEAAPQSAIEPDENDPDENTSARPAPGEPQPESAGKKSITSPPVISRATPSFPPAGRGNAIAALDEECANQHVLVAPAHLLFSNANNRWSPWMAFKLWAVTFLFIFYQGFANVICVWRYGFFSGLMTGSTVKLSMVVAITGGEIFSAQRDAFDLCKGHSPKKVASSFLQNDSMDGDGHGAAAPASSISDSTDWTTTSSFGTEEQDTAFSFLKTGAEGEPGVILTGKSDLAEVLTQRSASSSPYPRRRSLRGGFVAQSNNLYASSSFLEQGEGHQGESILEVDIQASGTTAGTKDDEKQEPGTGAEGASATSQGQSGVETPAERQVTDKQNLRTGRAAAEEDARSPPAAVIDSDGNTFTEAEIAWHCSQMEKARGQARGAKPWQIIIAMLCNILACGFTAKWIQWHPYDVGSAGHYQAMSNVGLQFALMVLVLEVLGTFHFLHFRNVPDYGATWDPDTDGGHWIGESTNAVTHWVWKHWPLPSEVPIGLYCVGISSGIAATFTRLGCLQQTTHAVTGALQKMPEVFLRSELAAACSTRCKRSCRRGPRPADQDEVDSANKKSRPSDMAKTTARVSQTALFLSADQDDQLSHLKRHLYLREGTVLMVQMLALPWGLAAGVFSASVANRWILGVYANWWSMWGYLLPGLSGFLLCDALLAHHQNGDILTQEQLEEDFAAVKRVLEEGGREEELTEQQRRFLRSVRERKKSPES
ncbi:unnamed protein product [Amoebophrya sp. A120]|nr:unnamed protein product [Amoebophrya sp. A120]|eukprot:GSA120T00005678001.1